MRGVRSSRPRLALRLQFLVGLLAPLAAACMESEQRVAAPNAPQGKAPSSIREAVERGEERQFIVVLDEAVVAREAALTGPAQPLGAHPGALSGDLAAATAHRAVGLAAAKQDLFARLPGDEVSLDRDYDHLPMFVASTDSADGLAALLADPMVQAIYEDQLYVAYDAASFGLIHQPAAIAAGKDGAGTAVAVIDTGVDYTRAAFGSCTAPGAPAACRVAYAHDFTANDDGARDDGEMHGTNVSGIVAGVAPGAKILGLDVFNGPFASGQDVIAAINWVIANKAAYNIVAINMSLGGGSFSSPCPNDAQAVAIDAARQAGILTAVATGNDAHANSVGAPACAPAAVSVGAVYAADYGGRLTWGGGTCSDDAPRAGQVTCFSNSASFVTVLAPGALIEAAGITMGGTSQASPHVAGALAVLRGAYPNESLDATVERLKSTGATTVDGRNQLSFKRLDLASAAQGCFAKLTPATEQLAEGASSFDVTLTLDAGCAWQIASDASWLTFPSGASGTGGAVIHVEAAANTVGTARSAKLTLAGDASAVVNVTQGTDTTPPTGSVVINDGVDATRSKSVTLAITGSDASQVTQMCVTNGTSCTAWEPFVTSKVWTLGGSATAKVTVFLKDGRGNATTAATSPSDTIMLDTQAPAGGAATITGTSGSLTLGWSGFNDALSGLDHYVVMRQSDSAPTAKCASGTSVYSGSETSFTQTGLTNGTTYFYRVCAVDKAGNLANGVTASKYPAPEYDPPTNGVIRINDGASYTRESSVTLTLGATDAHDLASMCVSKTASCPASAWEPYATTKVLTIGTTAGARTISAWFRDAYGNTTATAVSASITYDATAPKNGTVTATGSSGQVALSWTGFSDTGAGLARYVVMASATGTAPETCDLAASPIYTGELTTFTHSGLHNGTAYAYRVCAIDKAGNVSTGATVTRVPAPEYVAPTGSVTIAGGATYSRTASVSLSLAAQDTSGVASMCLKVGSGACTNWQDFAETATIDLGSGNGVRTVSAYFRDGYGNAMTTAATDSITVDAAPPSVGTLNAAPAKNSVTLSWSATDTLSGVARYRLVYLAGAVAPADACATGTSLYEGTATSFVHSNLTSGAAGTYRLCATDGAGNTASGKTKTATPL